MRASTSVDRQLLRMLTDDTGSVTLRIMDKVGIDKKLIMIVDWGFELGEAEKTIWQIHKDILYICRKHDDRLLAFAGVDPRRKDAEELLIWAFDSLGAGGLKLHPTGGWRLTDDKTQQILGLAAERNLPVLVHLGKTVDILNTENARPEPFMELAKKIPSSYFIAGHSGFDLWEVFEQDKSVPDNIFFDISGWQERIVGDGSNIIADLSRLHTKFPGRVCFGTDSPFYSFNLVPSEKQWIDRVRPAFIDQWTEIDFQKPNLLVSPKIMKS